MLVLKKQSSCIHTTANLVIFKWQCQLNQVNSIVIFIMKNHVGLELRNSDVNWEGTGCVSADVTKKGAVIMKPF